MRHSGTIRRISAFCHIQLLHNAYRKYKNYKHCKPYHYGKVHNQAKKNGHSQNGGVQAEKAGCGSLAGASASRCARSSIGTVRLIHLSHFVTLHLVRPLRFDEPIINAYFTDVKR